MNSSINAFRRGLKSRLQKGALPEDGKESLRARLLTDAENLLEEKGLNALTLRAVARASGVSHMAPYRHFTDKQALLASIAARGFSRLTLAMNQAAMIELPERQLLGVGVAYIEFAVTHPGLYRLMIGTSSINKSDYPELVEFRDKSYQCCYSAVKATYRVPPSDPDLPKQQALALWALVHGFSSMMIDGVIDYPKDDAEALKIFIAEKISVPMPEDKA